MVAELKQPDHITASTGHQRAAQELLDFGAGTCRVTGSVNDIWSDVCWYVRFTKKTHCWTVIIFVTSLASTAIGLLLPLLCSRLVDAGIVDKNFSYVVRSALLVFAGNAISFAVQAIGQFATQRLDMAARVLVLESTLGSIFHLPYSVLSKYKSGAVIRNVNNAANLVSRLSLAAFGNRAIEIGSALITITAMLYINAAICVPVVLAILALLLVKKRFELKRLALRCKGRQLDATSSGDLHEVLDGIRLVKHCQRESYEVARYVDSVTGQQESEIQSSWLTNTENVVKMTIEAIAGLGSIVVAGYYISRGQMTIGDLLAFSMYSQKLTAIVSTIGQNLLSYRESVCALQNVRRVIDMHRSGDDESRCQTHAAYSSTTDIDSILVFAGVYYQYETNSTEVLKNVNLSIYPGRVTGILGPSGCGKSTLCNLATRLLLPSRGTIYYRGSGQRTRHLRIGYVPQNVILLGRTLRANLMYHSTVDQTTPDDKILEALELCCINLGSDACACTLDTVLLDRENALSGGQRQRVAICRELLAEPDLLILDEATSGLDLHTENQLMENLRSRYPHMAILFISHRLQMSGFCDEVHRIVNHELRLVQGDGSGSDDETVAASGGVCGRRPEPV